MAKTFSTFDKFGLKQFADDLTEYLKIEYQFVDESFVLSLNSEFGSGKSTFFEMWEDDLNETGNIFKVVYINAWKSDYQNDPLLAIVSPLLDKMQTSKNAEPIKETTGKLCKFALSVGNDVIQKFIGINIIKAGQYAESKEGIAKPEIAHACFDLYKERHRLFADLKSLLCGLTKESGLPILVIVDELDRCRPNYAIEFLETIKHLFDISGLIFVIGVDKGQLASSAKALFGQDLVFDGYYRKFAHRNVNLPVKSETMTKQFSRKLVEEYLSEEAFEKKNRFYYGEDNRSRTENIVELCDAFGLNAREMHEFFRTTAHVLSITKESDRTLLWAWQVGVFFMVVLSIKNRIFYERIGSRKISLSEFTIFSKKLSLLNEDSRSGSFWWAALLYLGTFNDEPPLDKLEQEFQKLGVWEPSDEKEGAFKKELVRFNKGFSEFSGRDNPVFPKIYEVLEGLRTFESR